MILKMKKASLVMQRAQAESALESLGELGLLHVEEESPSRSPRVDALRSECGKLGLLSSALPKARETSGSFDEDERDRVRDAVEKALSKLAEIDEELVSTERDIAALAPWGDFDPALVEEVSARIPVSYYLCAKRDYHAPLYSWVVKKVAKQYYVLHLAPTEEQMPETWQRLALPTRSLSEASARRDELCVLRQTLVKQISKMRHEAEVILFALRCAEEELHFAEAREQLGSDDELSWITGYLPAREEKKLVEYAKQQSCGLLLSEVTEGDAVPTALSKGVLSSTIQPVFDMFGTVPGYREYDFRVLFLVFFTLFFGMIVSDAGYSSIFLVLTAFLSLKLLFQRRTLPRLLSLFAILSTGALLWGAFSGNWFGEASLLRYKVLSFVVFDTISVENVDSKTTIMFFCMAIGLTHLCIARTWSFFRALKQRSLTALAELGWISTLVGLFYLVLSMVVNAESFPVPFFAWPLIFAGLAANVIFAEQSGKFFRGILKGLGGLYTLALDAIGAFGDIISYIRLYAMGLAGLEVARNFNAMADSITASSDSAVVLVLAALVLVGGHSLNIVMGLLGVAVHGIRLNMLEFTRHLGMEWNGIAYRPLERRYVQRNTTKKENI